ncbi:LuxR C-terminal-related transcriptional regulator [Ideonella alba]|uniref:HTH luxR-type domain-containing protein n=1 Tax=Ideonella alba TaxID=2824118 RepID=A0A940Y582_9BURK|nr:LuxR C-terminal-related transcriptional regulator [Ideonella alba]MBQ0928941.1 hypothetical protein [Ideonella alba]
MGRPEHRSGRVPCSRPALAPVLLQQLPYAAFERDALIRTAEVALGVGNRGHLFTWLQLHLHRFVPHELVICHLPQLPASEATTVFHSVPLPPRLLAQLEQSSPRWLVPLRRAWVGGRRQPCLIDLAAHAELREAPALAQLRQQGIDRLLVHGVDAQACLRSESLFVFCTRSRQDPAMTAGLALWMPYLHAAAMRALAGGARVPETSTTPSSPLTARETQILQAVREARRTDEIAAQLDISPLTVKNHLRRIMVKLGARSRLHAVAEALSRQLIS